MASEWTPLCPVSTVGPGSRHLVRHDGIPIALWRDPQAGLRAADNRCPHEGYPLLDGPIVDGVLTCPWHNFKFRLSDGRCMQGDEDLALLPLREHGGNIEVDLRRPDPGSELPRRLGSLAAATVEGRMGQVARDLARCLAAGATPPRLAVFAACLDALHGEYGSSHALPAAADLLTLELEPDSRLLALMLPFELVSEGHRRRPAHRPADAAVGELDLAAHIEAERLEAAEASARALLAARGWPAVRERLQDAACAHFLDFGHPMIYVDKLDRLMPHADAEQRETLVLGLVRNVVTATREDLLPPMRRVRDHLQARELPRPRPGRHGADSPALRGFARALIDGDPAWMAALDASLGDDMGAEAIVDVLVRAASERLLRFDRSLHDRHDLQDGWLDVSHTLSHAHALRALFATQPRADAARSLYFGAHFVARCARLDASEADPVPTASPYDARRMRDALRARDVVAVQSMALGALDDWQLPSLRAELFRWALAESATRPIFVVHAFKMMVVAFAECAHLRSAEPLLATLRFAVTPKGERAIASLAHDAVRLVDHGRLPRRLSS